MLGLNDAGARCVPQLLRQIRLASPAQDPVVHRNFLHQQARPLPTSSLRVRITCQKTAAKKLLARVADLAERSHQIDLKVKRMIQRLDFLVGINEL
ncbi:hypothetical protein SS50377_24254 [Spironucleus salmonicida]|uniref:Uncharacterized protein n=1 Tax=Spironucleus salmonicida TaxID=348837 RepID=A0A9P8LTX6_9EUKA|nr:hypothetical protein SS50377_24254 [Spironucleus salmonicida]